MFEVGTATDYVDLMAKLDTFMTALGPAFGLTYAGTGNGTISGLSGGTATTPAAQTITITFTSATAFDVAGSVSGAIGSGTVGTPFSSSHCAFAITAGGTAFVAGDVFTFYRAKPATRKVTTPGARVTASKANTGIRAAQNLVDGKLLPSTSSLDWEVPSPLGLPITVEFEFLGGATQTIASYQMLAGVNNIYGPKDWTFEYWNGGSWVVLDTKAGVTSWGVSELKTFTISAPVAAGKYRLNITASNFSSLMALGAVRLLRSGNPDAASGTRIWELYGNDGLSSILIGTRHFERLDADYFNWELAMFTGYVAGLRFREQTGFHSKKYVPLWNASIPYWFAKTGRSVGVVAKINTQYEFFGLGLADQELTPAQYPYPAFIGGAMAHGSTLPTWESTAWRWSNATNRHRLPTHADPNGASPTTGPEATQCAVRLPTGAWEEFEGTDNDGTSITPTGKNILWPIRCGLSLFDPCLDGSRLLEPIQFHHKAPNLLGEFPGVFCVSGQGLSAETLLPVGPVNYLAIPNIFRTDRDDWVAFRLG